MTSAAWIFARPTMGRANTERIVFTVGVRGRIFAFAVAVASQGSACLPDAPKFRGDSEAMQKYMLAHEEQRVF